MRLIFSNSCNCRSLLRYEAFEQVDRPINGEKSLFEHVKGLVRALDDQSISSNQKTSGVDLTVQLFLRLLALHAFSKSNDRAIAATDANLFPVLLFNCQNLIFAPLRSNGQPTIYPADASRRFCQNQPNRFGDQARCFRSSAGY